MRTVRSTSSLPSHVKRLEARLAPGGRPAGELVDVARLLSELRVLAAAPALVPVANRFELAGLAGQVRDAVESRGCDARPTSPSQRSRPVPERNLTPRARQVLVLLKAGRSAKQVAHQMGISTHTVHAYVKTIYRQYRVNSRAELLALWLQDS